MSGRVLSPERVGEKPITPQPLPVCGLPRAIKYPFAPLLHFHRLSESDQVTIPEPQWCRPHKVKEAAIMP